MIDKKYRPFNNPKELKDFWNQFYSAGIIRPAFTNPDIWVELNGFDSEYKLTAFYDSGVDISGAFCSYEDLVKKYTFLNGSPCGIPVKEDELKNIYNNLIQEY